MRHLLENLPQEKKVIEEEKDREEKIMLQKQEGERALVKVRGKLRTWVVGNAHW